MPALDRIVRSLGFCLLIASVARAVDPDVTVLENDKTFTLSNGIVTAVVDKGTGNLKSLQYQQTELCAAPPKSAGFWSHNASSPEMKSTITIDPKTNGGLRAEVSVKGISQGKPMGKGPGGNAIADIENRYALERGQSGVYLYSIWTHPKSYPATNVGEARFCLMLNDDVFDWMTVDQNRNRKMITAHDWNYGEVLNMKEVRRMTTGEFKGQVEHKYDYAANQFETPAWGWSSTTKNLGLWMINPSVEYLSGGPVKLELIAHRDATFTPENKEAPAPPCLLNYWRSSHFGGSVVSVAEGEDWTKVIGPFVIYCNQGKNPLGLWHDALQKASEEGKAWPYRWVRGVDYPLADARADVTGRLILQDLANPSAKMTNVRIGLSAPAYTVSDGAKEVQVDWFNDAKHYEFWNYVPNEDGTFIIPNVRPGKYTLHAIADGVLGEFARTDIEIAPGHDVNLGDLAWTPQRFGKQLWEIGTPNRNASEFKHGDDYWHWGLYLQYPKDFPADVDFTIGKSNPRTEWNYAQVPRAQDDVAKLPGTSTTWTIRFDLPEAPKGNAILRLSLCGCGHTEISVAVNDHPAGSTGKLTYDGAINRDIIQGTLVEKDVRFDASLLKAGPNVMTLTIPAGAVTDGVEYDYLRLELSERQ